jgi:glycogen debranching enzyme
VRCARLARTIWEDRSLAARLETEAADLKRRFNRDFWLDEGQFFALALDGDKQPVDSLTSNSHSASCLLGLGWFFEGVPLQAHLV